MYVSSCGAKTKEERGKFSLDSISCRRDAKIGQSDFSMNVGQKEDFHLVNLLFLWRFRL